MSEIIDFKSRRKAANASKLEEEPQQTLVEWAQKTFTEDNLKPVSGIATVFFNDDGSVDFALTNLSWMETLWCARQLEAFALDEETAEDYTYDGE